MYCFEHCTYHVVSIMFKIVHVYLSIEFLKADYIAPRTYRFHADLFYRYNHSPTELWIKSKIIFLRLNANNAIQ